MRFEIHYSLNDGSDDFFVVEGDDMEELQKEAAAGVEQRGGKDPWSKELGD
jgi:hypothetical protein